MCKFLLALLLFAGVAASQETPITSPIKPWAFLPQAQFCEYRFAQYNNATPPGTGNFWIYQHTGVGRAGTNAVVTSYAVTSYPHDGGATQPTIYPSSCTPAGRVSWFQPDNWLTPLSVTGQAPFSTDFLCRVHPYNWFLSVGMYVPTNPALVGWSFYLEGVWWNQPTLPVTGNPCGIIATPFGVGNVPCMITFKP